MVASVRDMNPTYWRLRNFVADNRRRKPGVGLDTQGAAGVVSRRSGGVRRKIASELPPYNAANTALTLASSVAGWPRTMSGGRDGTTARAIVGAAFGFVAPALGCGRAVHGRDHRGCQGRVRRRPAGRDGRSGEPGSDRKS